MGEALKESRVAVAPYPAYNFYRIFPVLFGVSCRSVRMPVKHAELKALQIAFASQESGPITVSTVLAFSQQSQPDRLTGSDPPAETAALRRWSRRTRRLDPASSP